MTMRIDSPSNPRIAAAVKAIANGDTMLLEGRRMIEEALDAGVPVEEVFLQDEASEEKEDFLRKIRGQAEPEEGFPRKVRGAGSDARAPRAPARVTLVSERVLRRLSDLPSTRGVVALAPPPHRTLASLSSLTSLSSNSRSKKMVSSNLPRGAAPAGPRGSEPEGPLFLLLDDVQDPANVGAILRSAEAFGVAAALLTPGCAWPFSPRALRASAGSAFRLPIAARVAAGEGVTWARRHGIALAGAAAHGGTAPETLGGVRPLALVIGSEGHGISAEIAGTLDHRVTLPLAGRGDSLNAAVAAGVLLHILTRPAPAR